MRGEIVNMKINLKNILAKQNILAFLTFFLLTGCAKNTFKQNILGRWETDLTLDTEIGMDIDNPSVSSGVIRYKMIGSFEFFENGEFISRNEKKFERYTPLNELGRSVDTSEIAKLFSETVEMRGSYKINENILRYNLKFIKFNDGNEIDYEKYLEDSDMDIAGSVISVYYKIEDGNLIIDSNSGTSEKITYKRRDF